MPEGEASLRRAAAERVFVLADRKAARQLAWYRNRSAEAVPPSGKNEAVRKSIFSRIRHWWRRTPAGPAQAHPPALSASPSRDGDAKRLRESEPLDRLTVMAWLWGKGHVLPGGDAFALELAKPFGLNPSMSVLDLSAGLGGPARAIAKGFNVYVTGMERNYELARAGQQMSVVAGMERRAEIIHYDPEELEFRKHRFDCILGRLVTFPIRDKERFFRVVFEGLKPGGKLMLTDFVLEPGHGRDRALRGWMAHEPIPPVLWTVQQYEDCLSGLGFDLRISEDNTDSCRHMIVSAWSQMIQEHELQRLSRHDLGVIVDEAEFWAHRIAALERGGLRFVRFFALARK